MLEYPTRNKVAIEIFNSLLSWKFWVAMVFFPLLGLSLPLFHIPEPPQWAFLGFWAVMPIKKNLWERVVHPTTLFLWDLLMTPTLWIVFPILKWIWGEVVPLYHKTLGPYEERLIKPVAIPVFIFLLFYEEIVLWGLRKIVFPGVKLFIELAPAWLIVTIFAVLEIGKILAKPLLFVAFGFGFLPGMAFLLVYLAVTFFSLQIMVHGSDKLRSYAWFNRLYEWAVRTIGPLKEQAKKWWEAQPIYYWWKGAKEKAIENKNTFFARVTARAKSWRRKKTD